MLALPSDPKKHFFLIIFFIAIILGVWVWVNIVITPDLIREFSLNINAEEMTSEQVYSDYGGVPYEGESLFKITFSKSTDTDLIFADWNKLPLSDDINSFIYGINLDETSRAAEIHLPEIKSGKWAFVDRGTTSFDSPSAYNFSLCIWDSTNGVAYYYKIDT